MKKLQSILLSKTFLIVLGLGIIPFFSFLLISISEESPLYTSISRIAWIHGFWGATFIWAIIVMGGISWLTLCMVFTSPLGPGARERFFAIQLINICMVFVGCLFFPSKAGTEHERLAHLLHDYLTVIGWICYVIGLIVYTFLLRKKDRALGALGLGLMSYIILSSVFYLLNVIDSSSYVGASAVSEVHIINNLLIYLVVMYIAQDYALRIKTAEAKPTEKTEEDPPTE